MTSMPDFSPAEPTKEELQLYRRYVAKVAAVADGTTILNRTSEHAAVIIEHLFRKAEYEVLILTGGLYAPVYGTKEVADAATNFLRQHRNATISILAESAIDTSHPFLKSLDVGRTGAVDLKIVPPRVQKGYNCHFTVADGRFFRLESSRESFEAIVQFGDDAIGGKLRSMFFDLQKQIAG